MLSYQFSIKTLFPGIIRNDYIRSGNESHLRGVGFSSKIVGELRCIRLGLQS